MVGYAQIVLARNRTWRQHKVYLYEAEINMLRSMGCGSVSDTVHGIVAAFLERTEHVVDFLKPRDRLIIQNLRRAITSCR